MDKLVRGLLGGQLWLLYEHTQDAEWREKAEHYSRLVEHRKTDRNATIWASCSGRPGSAGMT